mgnify:CR=1 FL=1
MSGKNTMVRELKEKLLLEVISYKKYVNSVSDIDQYFLKNFSMFKIKLIEKSRNDKKVLEYVKNLPKLKKRQFFAVAIIFILSIQILLLILKYDIIEVRLISIVSVVPFLFFYDRFYLRKMKGKKIKLIKELDKLEELLKN